MQPRVATSRPSGPPDNLSGPPDNPSGPPDNLSGPPDRIAGLPVARTVLRRPRVSVWKSTKARQLFKALERIGWTETRRSGSHRTMVRPGWPPMSFAFHDSEEIGARMVAKIAKKMGLRPHDL